MKVQIDILGSKRLTVLTNSLTEVIEPGDVVIVKKINMEDILVGDIICFTVDYTGKGDMKVFTHIVAEIKNNDGIYEVHTKSTLSDRWDNWVLSEQDIVGRVERYFHGPFYYLQQNPNYFLLICIFSSVCFLVVGIVLLTVKEEKTNFKHIIKKYDYTENLLKKFKKTNIKNSIKK